MFRYLQLHLKLLAFFGVQIDHGHILIQTVGQNILHHTDFYDDDNVMRTQSAFTATAKLIAYAAGIFDSWIDEQMNQLPELTVDSKVRREQRAKDHGSNLKV